MPHALQGRVGRQIPLLDHTQPHQHQAWALHDNSRDQTRDQRWQASGEASVSSISRTTTG